MVDVVKIGGGVIDSPEQLQKVIAAIARKSVPCIVVHGGGKVATSVAERLGIPQTMLGGRRVTDAATLQVVTMVYAGWINKTIVGLLQQHGVEALGLSGADLNLVRAVRRSPHPTDYGYVGDVTGINTEIVERLLGIGKHNEQSGPPITRCLVVAPIAQGNGTLLNINADTIATEIALAIGEGVTLTFAFEHGGVLADVSNSESVLPLITAQQAQGMVANGTIHSGMLPKIELAIRAANAGVQRVRITKYNALDTEDGTWIAQ